MERRRSAISVVRRKRFLVVSHVGVPSDVDSICANNYAMLVLVRHVRLPAENRGSSGKFSLNLFST